MSTKKNSTNPNKKRNQKKAEEEPKIHCPKCGCENLTYEKDRRRVPSPWYVHAGCAVAVVVFLFIMPWFSLGFALVYIYFTLRKQKVLVGTCQECGEETLFNQPEDGSDTPSFNKPWV